MQCSWHAAQGLASILHPDTFILWKMPGPSWTSVYPTDLRHSSRSAATTDSSEAWFRGCNSRRWQAARALEPAPRHPIRHQCSSRALVAEMKAEAEEVFGIHFLAQWLRSSGSDSNRALAEIRPRRSAHPSDGRISPWASAAHGGLPDAAAHCGSNNMPT